MKWIVVDWSNTMFYGPFDTEESALAWILKHGYENREAAADCEIAAHSLEMPEFVKALQP